MNLSIQAVQLYSVWCIIFCLIWFCRFIPLWILWPDYLPGLFLFSLSDNRHPCCIYRWYHLQTIQPISENRRFPKTRFSRKAGRKINPKGNTYCICFRMGQKQCHQPLPCNTWKNQRYRVRSQYRQHPWVYWSWLHICLQLAFYR